MFMKGCFDYWEVFAKAEREYTKMNAFLPTEKLQKYLTCSKNSLLIF